MTAMAIREIIYGTTIRILWLRGKGPENRAMDMLSRGPMDTIDRVDLRMGSMMVAVASVYNSMGDVSENAFTILARVMTLSGSDSVVSDESALASILAPSETKNEKNIHMANAAKADVAVLRNTIEKSMATPSHREI